MRVAVPHGSERLTQLNCSLQFGAVLCASLLISFSASAAIFEVNDLGDGTDAVPGDGVAETAEGNGVTTLRAAIEEANATQGPDTIVFLLGGTIATTLALPPLDDASGATRINGDGQVTLDGGAVLGVVSGITLHSAGNVINGIHFANFSGGGVDLSGSAARDNEIVNCQIGIAGRNEVGVLIQNGAFSNTIGGNRINTRNIISGNGVGISISGAGSIANNVYGNYIGTDISGDNPKPNETYGVLISGGATFNRIGGGTAGDANTVSGNGSGIRISGPGTAFNVVQGNIVGANATASVALSNTAEGIAIAAGATSNRVGGTTLGAKNLIVSNGVGVSIAGAGTSLNAVEGNFIGVRSDGSAGFGNAGAGVVIRDGASGNLIGGRTSAVRNIISDNSSGGVLLTGVDTALNTVEGNYVGVAPDGQTPLGNTGFGVSLALGARNNSIGGLREESANILSGNTGAGVLLSGNATVDNQIIGNRIGLDAVGVVLANTGAGVEVVENASGNVIGGEADGAANQIIGNGRNGILVGDGSTGIRIARNDIHGNTDQGISLTGVANLAIEPPSIQGLEPIAGVAPVAATIELFVDDADQGEIFLASGTADATGVFSIEPASLVTLEP